MNEVNLIDGSGEDDFSSLVFGDEPTLRTPEAELEIEFCPWHHPVKQIVRSFQWGDLSKKLLDARDEGDRAVLRYFSLPGKDLLDVRYLSDRLVEYETKVEYFGFDSSLEDAAAAKNGSLGGNGESALRQVGKITDNSIVMPDRLEDISEERSQAAEHLSRQAPFDVVNIDACNHLAHVPKGRTKTLFDAFHKLLAHQLHAKKPWLLFLTTRVDPELLGAPADRFKEAIARNLAEHPDDFPKVLGSCVEVPVENIDADLHGAWDNLDKKMLRAYSVGLTKHLLQFFHGQGNFQAAVHLNSVYCYRVKADSPDMLSFAFTISPEPIRINPPATNGQVVGDRLELEAAKKAIIQVKRLWDLDGALSADSEWRPEILAEAEALLEQVSYSIPDWKNWVRNHDIRPVPI